MFTNLAFTNWGTTLYEHRHEHRPLHVGSVLTGSAPRPCPGNDGDSAWISNFWALNGVVRKPPKEDSWLMRFWYCIRHNLWCVVLKTNVELLSQHFPICDPTNIPWSCSIKASYSKTWPNGCVNVSRRVKLRKAWPQSHSLWRGSEWNCRKFQVRLSYTVILQGGAPPVS